MASLYKKEKPKDNKTNKENNNKKKIILRKIIRIHHMSLFRILLPLKKTHPPQKKIQFSHQNHQLHNNQYNKKTQLLNKIMRLQIIKILHNDSKNLQHNNKTHLNIRRIQQIMIQNKHILLTTRIVKIVLNIIIQMNLIQQKTTLIM